MGGNGRNRVAVGNDLRTRTQGGSCLAILGTIKCMSNLEEVVANNKHLAKKADFSYQIVMALVCCNSAGFTMFDLF